MSSPWAPPTKTRPTGRCAIRATSRASRAVLPAARRPRWQPAQPWPRSALIPAARFVSRASSNLARFEGVRYGHRTQQARSLSEMYRRTRDEGFGAEVKRRIMLGTYALSAGYYDAYYLKAQRVRTLLTRDFEAAFAQVDAIVTPTTPTPAFKLGEKTDDPLAMYLADLYTVTADLVGIPGISVPCGSSKSGLPIGLQILGRHFDEPTLFRLAHVYEHARVS